jgi:hypothetical protein
MILIKSDLNVKWYICIKVNWMINLSVKTKFEVKKLQNLWHLWSYGRRHSDVCFYNIAILSLCIPRQIGEKCVFFGK